MNVNPVSIRSYSVSYSSFGRRRRGPLTGTSRREEFLTGTMSGKDNFVDLSRAMIDKGKEDLIKQAKYLSDKNLTAGSGGNISMRLGDKILISAAGSMFSDLTPEDVSVVNENGELLEGAKPSSETPIHAAVYKARPDVNSVIHFHPVYATVYAVAGRTMLPNILPHTTKHFSDIKVIPYKNAGTKELAEQVATEIGKSEAILMGNHGALVVGKTPKIAAKTADSLENYAKVSYLVENSDFSVNTLSSNNVAYMLNQGKK